MGELTTVTPLARGSCQIDIIHTYSSPTDHFELLTSIKYRRRDLGATTHDQGIIISDHFQEILSRDGWIVFNIRSRF